jgi:hypothetical protein
VINNALLYNKAGTVFHKTALRIQKEAKTILSDLEYIKYPHATPVMTNGAEEDKDNLKPIGDLEPPLDVLKLLVSSDAIKSDLNMELDVDPVTSLINYEFAKVKPPPLPSPLVPPPPPRTRKPKVQKPKRDYKAELERARLNREARAAASHDSATQNEDKHPGQETDEGQESKWESDERDEEEEARRRDREIQAQLDASAGFRAPRTRGAQAAEAAFEAEAGGPSTVYEAALPPPPSQPTPEPEPEISKPVQPLKKRASGTFGQTTLPRVVHDVGNRDSFSMFNAGWILPPDQKRGGRPATDRHLPPPKKRQKTGKFYPLCYPNIY